MSKWRVPGRFRFLSSWNSGRGETAASFFCAHLLVIAGLKNVFNGLREESRDGKRQRQTRGVLSGFNCVHGLARNLETPGQVGLGPLALCAETSKAVFHHAPARGRSVRGQSLLGQ